MPEHRTEQGEENKVAVHANVRYQPDDAPAGPIIKFGVWLIVLAVVVHVVTAVLYYVFIGHEDARQAPLSPIMAKDRLELPRDMERVPRPHLRTNDVQSIEQLRREEDARLQGYGWIDAQNEVVRIPIAEAMKRLADPEVAKARGLRSKGESP